MELSLHCKSLFCTLTCVNIFIILSIIRFTYASPGLNADHFAKDGHNVADILVGKEEAKRLEDLSPLESRAELEKIFHKIDENKDGFVDEGELKQWIAKIQRRYVRTDSERQWREYGLGEDSTLDFSTFMRKTYGYDSEDTFPKDGFDYFAMLERDKRRWAAAAEASGTTGNESLKFEAFEAFLHPEEFAYMHPIVVAETLEDIDKNGDGAISLEEYIGDMWPEKEKDPNSAEPDWVQSERESFVKYRDSNGDGVMDSGELKKWLLPSDYDHAAAEARHLIYEADTNKDGYLSSEEVATKHDLFVGSQALDFGEALRYHDEL